MTQLSTPKPTAPSKLAPFSSLALIVCIPVCIWTAKLALNKLDQQDRIIETQKTWLSAMASMLNFETNGNAVREAAEAGRSIVCRNQNGKTLVIDNAGEPFPTGLRDFLYERAIRGECFAVPKPGAYDKPDPMSS